MAILVASIVLALLWLALVVRALFLDRSRGRRRCPKCGFELDHASARTCPECGTTAPHEASLYWTRRHWTSAALATALFLLPAIAGVGVHWIRVGDHWHRLPDAILVRMLPMENDSLDVEVQKRAWSNRLSKAQHETVILEAIRRLDDPQLLDKRSAYDLLDAIARYNVVVLEDAEHAVPTLGDLYPTKLTDALLSRLETAGQEERIRILPLLHSIGDADVRTMFSLLRAMTAFEDDVLGFLQDDHHEELRTSRRPPFPLPTKTPGFLRPTQKSTRETLRVLAHVFNATPDSKMDEVAIMMATTGSLDDASEAHPNIVRAIGLWLACYIRADEETWALVERRLADPNPMVRSVAVRLIAAFPWTDATETHLVAACRDDALDVRASAVEAAHAFAPGTSVLIEEFLDIASNTRLVGTSAFPRQFVELGGDPHDLLDVLIERVRTHMPEPFDADTLDARFAFNWAFLWIESLEVQDTEAARVLEPFMNLEGVDMNKHPLVPSRTLPLRAAAAHAVLTGHGAIATRTILRTAPELPGDSGIGTASWAMLRLAKRGMLEASMLFEHYVLNPLTADPEGLAEFIEKWRLEDLRLELNSLGDSHLPSGEDQQKRIRRLMFAIGPR